MASYYENILEDSKLPFVNGYALQCYLTAEDGIILASKHNYEYWYIDGSMDTEAPLMWNKERIKNILSLMEKYKTKPIYHGNFKVPLASDVNMLRMAAIEYVKQEIDLAAQLGCPLIIHGGAIVEPRLVIKAKKHAIKNYLSSILALTDYAEKKNITLYLENLSNYKNYRPFHYIFTHEDEFEFILSETNAKFFLDLGHANIGNSSPGNIFKKFHKYIIGMSFSNNNGLNDQHLSLKKGTLDYVSIISLIQEKNWSGIIGFEIRDATPEKNIRELTHLYHLAS